MKIGEIWLEVPSVPGMLASSLGRVMADAVLDRPMPQGGQRDYISRPWLGAWQKGSGTGRYILRFRGRTHKVARLVCEAFHGPPPDDRAVCMHLDENSRNNRPENLRWGSQKQNLNAPGFLQYCRERPDPRLRRKGLPRIAL